VDSRPRSDAFAPGEAAALQRARIISGALMSGVAAFACVSAVLVSRGAIRGTLPPAADNYLSAAWLAGLGAMLAAPALGRLAGRGSRTGSDAFVVQTVVAQAFREGVGMAGMVFALLAGRVEWILFFAGLALAAMALGWPRASSLREAGHPRDSLPGGRRA
jgi:hypothetical protein